MTTNFKKLIIKYADGREICNCGEAYYTNCGKGYWKGRERNDLPACAGGCSSNIKDAKEYIAKQVIEELANRGVKI